MNWQDLFLDNMARVVHGLPPQVPLSENKYTNPDAFAFKWVPDDEPNQPENWLWVDGHDLSLQEVFEPLLKYGAVPAVVFEGEESVEEIALLDSLYGIALQMAAKRKEHEMFLDIPRLVAIGNSSAMQKVIRWRNYLGFAITEIANHAVRDIRVQSEFNRSFDFSMMLVEDYLRLLYVAPNLTSIFREEDEEQEFFMEPQLETDCGYAGARGWWRVEALLHGKEHTCTFPTRHVEQIRVATEVMDFLLDVYSKAVTEDVFQVLFEMNQFNKTNYCLE